MKINKRYLGDGVYICIERGMFKIWTSDGITVKNEIFMEPEVYRELKSYAEEALNPIIKIEKGENDDIL